MRVAPTFTELIGDCGIVWRGEKYENWGKHFEHVEKEAPRELITELLFSVRVLTFRGAVLEAFVKVKCLCSLLCCCLYL